MVNEVAIDPCEQLAEAIKELNRNPQSDDDIITVDAKDMRQMTVKIGPRDPLAEVTCVPVEFVGRIVEGERGGRYWGWVYEGPLCISDIELKELVGGESGLPRWLKKVLGPRCVRAVVLDTRDGVPWVKVDIVIEKTAR
jgi:hypothetical protein